MSEVRIQKVFSDNGILSRRKAEEAIQGGRVTVDGHPAQLGQKIDPRRNIITLDGNRLDLRRKVKPVYIMLHKPRGVVTTTSDNLGRKCVLDILDDAPSGLYPVGRLDMQSEGLILLTNDGDFANRIIHPSGELPKTYRVTVRGNVDELKLIQLATGVEIDGRMTLPASVHALEKQTERSVLQMTIFEGRNRQIRKMCEAVGLEVARLKRVSIGPLKLGMLQPGKWRELAPHELVALRTALQKAKRRSDHQENSAEPGQGKRKLKRPSPRKGR